MPSCSRCTYDVGEGRNNLTGGRAAKFNTENERFTVVRTLSNRGDPVLAIHKLQQKPQLW